MAGTSVVISRKATVEPSASETTAAPLIEEPATAQVTGMDVTCGAAWMVSRSWAAGSSTTGSSLQFVR